MSAEHVKYKRMRMCTGKEQSGMRKAVPETSM